MPVDGQALEEPVTVRNAAADPVRFPASQRLIVASNRGPVEYKLGLDGRPVAQRGAGGVVSGLLCAVAGRPVTWVGVAMTPADRLVARAGACHAGQMPTGMEHIDVRLVDVPEDAYQRYYSGISNRVLWFAQHYLLKPTSPGVFSRRTRLNWEHGYVTVNDAIAEAVMRELERLGSDTTVLFQDYHLYLAAARVRQRFPAARLAHFTHIPWPDARYWEMLPEYIVQSLHEGLAANDVIGFQTTRDARNFLVSAERFLPGSSVELNDEECGQGLLEWQGRRITVGAFPIAVTPDEVRQSASSHGAVREAVSISQRVSADLDHQVILRVDRVEPTKNIVLGFRAYGRLLRQHPELHGRVTFLALLVPSRQSMREYRNYDQQVRREIARVNEQFQRPGWQPIVAIFGNHRARALACMRRADVLLVNPVIDGMNLVVKEAGLVNARNGVTVLSRTAGAYEQLRDCVLGVPPLDVQATADALFEGLAMDVAERTERMTALRQILEGESAAQWMDAQIARLPARKSARRLLRVPQQRQRAALGVPAVDSAIASVPTADDSFSLFA